MILDQSCPVCDRVDRVVEVPGADGLLHCRRCDEHFEPDDMLWAQPEKTRKTRLSKDAGY